MVNKTDMILILMEFGRKKLWRDVMSEAERNVTCWGSVPKGPKLGALGRP